MSWKEIDISNEPRAHILFVTVTKGIGGTKLMFTSFLTSCFKGYDYCKALIDVEQKLIGIKLEKEGGKNHKKITFNTPSGTTERVLISFTREWEFIQKKFSLPEIEKTIKYKVYQEKKDFLVIDCNKTL